MSFPSNKLPEVGTTIFSIMSQMAVEHGAINLGQGFPGFPVDPQLIDKVTQAMRAGHNQYAPMPGIPPLRHQIAQKMMRFWNVNFDPQTQITITAGASQAIFTAIGALIEPGDEVILFAPAYDCYAPAITLNGGKIHWIELDYPDFSIPWQKVYAAVNDRTKLIMMNNPHNPTGGVWRRDDTDQMAKLVKDTGIYLISDEVYEHIVFDGEKHISMCLYPEIQSQTMLTYSFGKTFHATGWKLGYAIGPEDWMREFRKQHQFNVFTCNSPFQYAIAEYMEDMERYDLIAPMYQKKRDLLNAFIPKDSFECISTPGTYFQLLKYKGEEMGSDVELAKLWTKRNKITLIPISVFYPEQKDERVLRLCFAKEDEELNRAGEALQSIQ
jgi:methionine aminotransferase